MGNYISKNRIHSQQVLINKNENNIAKEHVKKRGRRTSVSAECIDVNDDNDNNFIKKIVPKSSLAYERIRQAVVDNIIFQSLDDTQKCILFDAMMEKKVIKDEIIIKEGEYGDYFYVIDSGQFNVYIKDNLVFKYESGGSFGELALMYNSPRAATIKAMNDGILWALDRETFRHIIVKTNIKKAKSYENILNKINIIKNLTSKQKSLVVDSLIECEFQKNDYIISQGDNDCSNFLFYIIVEGNVIYQYKSSKTNETQIVGNGQIGDYFGEKALLLKTEPRACSVIANSTKVKCLSMDRTTFERLMGPIHSLLEKKIDEYTNLEVVSFLNE